MKRVPANPTGTASLLYNPNQVAFLEAFRARLPNGGRAYDRLTLFAGRRGGKTEIGGLAIAEAAQEPGQLIWVCAPTFEKLYEAVWPAVFRYIPDEMIDLRFHNSGWSEQHQELVLQNETIIRGRSLDNVERARCVGLNLAWLDEAREMDERAWDAMEPALLDKRGTVVVTTSPNGFDWVYERFWKPALCKEAGYWGILYKTSANPVISPEEIARLRRSMSAEMFRQELEAEFISFRGAIYGDRVRRALLHSDDEVKAILPSWPLIPPGVEVRYGIDPGASKEHPYAAVFGALTEKGLLCFAEYWNNDGLPTRLHAAELLRHIPPGERSIYAFCDKQRKTDMIELAQHGVRAAPAENAVQARIDRVRAWLEQGKLFIVEARCPHLVEELQTYRWQDSVGRDGAVGQKPQPFKRKDDTCDALGYLCMSWPSLPIAEATPSDGRDLSRLPIRPQDVRGWKCEQAAKKAYAGGEEELELLPVDDADYPMGQFWS